MLSLSTGIMAYNEGTNIGRLLDSLLSQRTSVCSIEEIYVVASGCTDNTEDVVRNYIRKDERIKILIQEKREGKASAINLFLSHARGEVSILVSADTILEDDTIDHVVRPFSDPVIGMTGGHPVPVNNPDTFIGFSVGLLWRLHHRIALEHPKLGELIAFRNVVKEIPHDTAVDEASIEARITDLGYRLRYVEDAIVHNKGAENIRDFLKQRRRIAAGHLYVKLNQGYSVSTTSWKYIVKPLTKEMRWGGKEVLWTLGAISLEVIGRALGYYDFYIRKRNPFIWDMAASTKDLTGISR